MTKGNIARPLPCLLFIFVFFKTLKSTSNGSLVFGLKSGEKVSPEKDAKWSHQTVNTNYSKIFIPLTFYVKGLIAVILGTLRAPCGPAQDTCLTTQTGRQAAGRVLCEELSWKNQEHQSPLVWGRRVGGVAVSVPPLREGTFSYTSAVRRGRQQRASKQSLSQLLWGCKQDMPAPALGA